MRWSHSPVKGITGYIAPDEDVTAIRRRLVTEQGSSNLGIPPPSTQTQNPPLDQIDPRDRHITGEETTEDTMDTTEEVLLQTPPCSTEPLLSDIALTAAQEIELLGHVNLPKSDPDETLTPEKIKKSPSPPANRDSKYKRRMKEDGQPATDPSDIEA